MTDPTLYTRHILASEEVYEDKTSVNQLQRWGVPKKCRYLSLVYFQLQDWTKDSSLCNPAAKNAREEKYMSLNWVQLCVSSPAAYKLRNLVLNIFLLSVDIVIVNRIYFSPTSGIF